MNKHKKNVIIYAALATFSTACGVGNEREVTSSGTTSMITNTSAASDSISSNLSDALEALSDSNLNLSTTSLALQDSSPVSMTRERSCLEEGDQAIVAIESLFEGRIVIERQLATITRDVSGGGSITRTWARDGSPVPCNEAGTHAAIEWSAEGVADLSLDVTIARFRSANSDIIKGDVTISRSMERSANGTRSIQWLSHTDNEDGTFTQLKSVSSSMTRTTNKTSSNGDSVSLALTVETVAGEDLEISVVRDSTDHSLIAKTISSGSLKSYENENEHVVSSFNDYFISFSDTSCTPTSGTITSRFYEGEDTEPVKIVELAVNNGAYTMTDITDADDPQVIEDFEYELCHVSNFK